MGIVKVVISFVKYIPQVYLNWRRKSTEGWSLENVLLDFTGGTLTFAQIFLDWASSGKTSQFSSGLNVAKFLLAILSIGFDLIFMFQHYVLYSPKKRRSRGELRDSLTEKNSKNPKNYKKFEKMKNLIFDFFDLR